MGGNGSHMPILPSLPSKLRKAAITQALGKKFDKRKRLSRTLKRIIHYNSKHPNKDQCKLIRELLSHWTIVELSRLVEIYESTITLHQVAAEAASARSLINTAALDLLTLLERQICTDVIVKYRESCFPCHKAILAMRSEYFKKLFSQMEVGDVIDVSLPPSSPNIEPAVFLQFLHYLYSDNLPSEELISVNNLATLCHHFGVASTADQMLRQLHDASEYCDVTLVFLRTNQPNTSICEPVRLAEYPCHSSVLSSRSELLCNLIRRRIGTATNLSPTEIVLDDAVVSHKYAPLLLKIIYRDDLDLSLINSQANAATSSSLSEAQAIVAGRSNITLLEETKELHHIGNFLELPVLIEKCEDYIVQNISAENLSNILTWSQESSGSRWVYREALQYIQDNFMQISQCPALFSLDESTLAKVLQSDFLQASEFDVLRAIVNWSEHQLIRRLERREPNLVSHTAHSLAKKAVKTKDLDDSELREIASPLMLHVRQSHLLCSNPDVISCAVKRGLIGGRGVTPHRDLTASEPVLNQHTSYGQRGAWVPLSKSSSCGYEIPRAYMPFYDVARCLLEERTKDMSESDVVHLRRPSRPNSGLNTLSRSRMFRHSTVQNMTRIQEELSQLAFGQCEVDEVIKRTQQLLQTNIVVQALQACWDKSAVLKQVCLWAVRELGYADQIIYTINNTTNLPAQSSTDNHTADFLCSSLVPDLAPERLILRHGLSSSYENLTIHSVNSSPDVTLLSVRSYRQDIGTAPFPDVTLHSHSSSENEDGLHGSSAKSKNRLVSSLQRVRKRSKHSVMTRSLASNNDNLPEIMKHSLVLSAPTKSDSPLQPDVLEGSPPTSEPDLMPNMRTLHHAFTLDSRPHRSRARDSQATNPYHTPPRSTNRSINVRPRADSSSHHNLLYSSLTRNMNTAYNSMLASAGPPPDIAPQPPRRLTGTSTPPDITSSPNNTWQAML